MGDLVHLRLGEKLIREIDTVVKSETYENRSEFIKEALRKAVEERRKKRLIESLRSRLGEGKRLGIKEPAPEEFEKIREEVGNELLKRHGKRSEAARQAMARYAEKLRLMDKLAAKSKLSEEEAFEIGESIKKSALKKGSAKNFN